MKFKKYMDLIPKRIPKETKEWIEKEVFYKSKYIFIKKEKGKNIGYCTCCKKEYEIDFYHHNEIVYCINCRGKCIVKLTRYRRDSLKDVATVLIYQKANKEEDTLVARGFLLERDFSSNYKDTKTKYLELAVYVFRTNENKMFCNYNYWNWHGRENIFDRSGFHETSSIYSFNINGLKNINYSVDYRSLKNAVKESRFKYSLWEKHTGTDMLRYFDVYNKYPIIESLQKIGFDSIVNYKLEGRSLQYQTNWRGKTICDVLKLNKGQIRDIQESNVHITPEFLKLYRINNVENYKLTNTELKDIERITGGYYRYGTILKHTNIKKMYRYVTKQYELSKGEYSTYQSVVNIWLDYIEDCKELGLDIKDEKVLFTKNVFNHHLNLQKQIKYKKDLELDRLIKERQEERGTMYFRYKNLEIRPAINTEEIIEEGKKLGHCVGSYAKKHANGETTILFVRKIGEIDKPYFTVEIKNNKILQVYGLKNQKANDEVNEFIEMYKKKN